MLITGELNIDQNFSCEKYEILRQLFKDYSDDILFLSIFKSSKIEPSLLYDFKNFLKSLDRRVIIIPGEKDFDRRGETFLSLLSDSSIEVIETAREIDGYLFIPSYEISSINLDILYRYSTIFTTDLKIKPFFKEGRWSLSDIKDLKIISSGYPDNESIYLGSPFQTDFSMSRKRAILQIEEEEIREIGVPQFIEYITIKRLTDSRYQIEDRIFSFKQLTDYLYSFKNCRKRFKGRLFTYLIDREISSIKDRFKNELSIYLYEKGSKSEENRGREDSDLVGRILNNLTEEERSYLDKLQII